MKVLALLLVASNAEEFHGPQHALNVGMCKELLRDCNSDNPHYCSNKNRAKIQRYLCNPGCQSVFTEDSDVDSFNEMCSRVGLRNVAGLCPQGGCNGAFDLFHINGYGCWCNFGDNLLKGYGKAQDPYDAACRDYQQCLRCTAIDSNNDCNPKENDYEWSISGLWSGCGASSTCESQLCECQTDFLRELFMIRFVQNLDISLPLNHVMGFNIEQCDGGDRLDFLKGAEPIDLDYDYGQVGVELFNEIDGRADMQSDVVSIPVEKKCCGVYPDRVPFIPGTKRCCAQVNLFNFITEECCSNGETAILGQC